MMHKVFLLVLWWSALTGNLFAQSDTAYIRLADPSGTQRAALALEDLEEASDSLVAAFPMGLQDSFRVIDLGYYLHNPVMQGIPALFEEAQVAAGNRSEFYLLFGRESGPDGFNARIRVAVHLPESGPFECVTETQREQLTSYLNTKANEKPEISLDEREQAVIAFLEKHIRRIVDCDCAQSRNLECTQFGDPDYVLLSMGFRKTAIQVPGSSDWNNSGDILDFAQKRVFLQGIQYNIAEQVEASKRYFDAYLKGRVYILDNESFDNAEWGQVLDDIGSETYDYVECWVILTDEHGESHLYSRFFIKHAEVPMPTFQSPEESRRRGARSGMAGEMGARIHLLGNALIDKLLHGVELYYSAYGVESWEDALDGSEQDDPWLGLSSLLPWKDLITNEYWEHASLLRVDIAEPLRELVYEAVNEGEIEATMDAFALGIGIDIESEDFICIAAEYEYHFEQTVFVAPDGKTIDIGVGNHPYSFYTSEPYTGTLDRFFYDGILYAAYWRKSTGTFIGYAPSYRSYRDLTAFTQDALKLEKGKPELAQKLYESSTCSLEIRVNNVVSSTFSQSDCRACEILRRKREGDITKGAVIQDPGGNTDYSNGSYLDSLAARGGTGNNFNVPAPGNMSQGGVFDYASTLSAEEKAQMLQNLGLTLGSCGVEGIIYITDYLSTPGLLDSVEEYVDTFTGRKIVIWLHLSSPTEHNLIMRAGDGLEAFDSPEVSDFIDALKAFCNDYSSAYLYFNPLTAMLDGLAGMISKAQIPERFYNPEAQNYNDLPWLVYNLLTLGFLDEGIVSTMLPGATNLYEPGKMEFAMHCGVFNGAVILLAGLPESGSFVVKIITNEDSTRTNLCNVFSSMSWGKMDTLLSDSWNKFAQANDCVRMHSLGKVFFDVFTIAMAFTKVGPITRALNVIDRLDAVGQVVDRILIISGKVMKPIFLMGIRTVRFSAEVGWSAILRTVGDYILPIPVEEFTSRAARAYAEAKRLLESGDPPEFIPLLGEEGEEIIDAYGNTLYEVEIMIDGTPEKIILLLNEDHVILNQAFEEGFGNVPRGILGKLDGLEFETLREIVDALPEPQRADFLHTFRQNVDEYTSAFQKLHRKLKQYYDEFPDLIDDLKDPDFFALMMSVHRGEVAGLNNVGEMLEAWKKVSSNSTWRKNLICLSKVSRYLRNGIEIVEDGGEIIVKSSTGHRIGKLEKLGPSDPYYPDQLMTRGHYSDRHFDPDDAGGVISAKSWASPTINTAALMI